ncbi:MAG: alkaline phosphatase PhoX [Saprospiraceae bacterium]
MSVKNKKLQRRSFIQFLGKGVVATSLLPPFISACNIESSRRAFDLNIAIKGISPSDEDNLVLADGLDYKVLIRYGDKISKNDTFGFNCDYTAFIPGSSPDEGFLWVNHEYVDPVFVSTGMKKSKERADKEMYNIGGSILKMKKSGEQWKNDTSSDKNRRITAHTMIPFNWPEKIYGATEAMGTLQNCAGGVTPWGTVLTCEENYHSCYGERDFETGEVIKPQSMYDWGEYYDNPPEHYGWVVEVDPHTGKCQKHVALGRCAHECATCVELQDKRVVVYSGDDKVDQCVYKFISDKAGSLKSGKLYVANVSKGKWESLDINDQEVLKNNFKDQTEVLIRLREAAALLGGTPLARPEDIEIDPVTGNILIALTNDVTKGNYYGEILKIEETGGKYDSLTFKADTFLAGGEETGFACPDNLAFDNGGNLWFTSDISGSAMNKEPYASFKNNGLFVFLRSGDNAGEVVQIASAPKDAELTGPFFTPDGKTLFLSVQHPGGLSPSVNELTSNWPNGGNSLPAPSVVTIQGPLLNAIQGIKSFTQS